MKKLEDAARAAGIHRIDCPSCGHRFNTKELFRRLFAGMLSILKTEGERINVPQFGIFSSVILKAREHKSPIMPNKTVKWSSDKLVLRFKQAAHVRRFLNPVDEDAAENGRKAAAHKKQQQAKQDEALKRMRERERKAGKKKSAKKKATKKKAGKKRSKR